MIVNALFTYYFPHQPLINVLEMILTFGECIIDGILFFRWVESREACHKTRLPILAGLMASTLFSVVGSNT